MKTTTRLLLIALLSLPLLAACQKDDAASDTVADADAKPAVTRPADNNDEQAWGVYLSDVVTRNMGDISNNPYLYYLPSSESAGFEGAHERLKEEIEVAMQRGIVEGNLVAFGSPESAMMADIVVGAFAKVDPGSMKGVKLLFIGDAADNERVRAAVEPAGVNYQFVEAK
ncbi:hypothetical protein N799_05905 [Lysobacter arseniciresistens ZS79]|uniref:Uncharacterized protein n=1 Tax=Lysobacter arseniciresistens ZS79 TaxID=913325 RepID=A0A0A0F5D9_9GAMM|nr:hypothetical protein [Lysobacter arseniciresistens]KGM57588.1 hypothetical protein N799_05905 [Lysobacter arseniciresistens ZS79]